MLKNKKIMVASLAEDASIIITKSDNKKAEFEIIGNLKKESVFDMEVCLMDESIGIIRKKEKPDDVILELWEDNSIKSGDILNIKKNIDCKGDLLYGFNLSADISRRIADILITDSKLCVNQIYFTSLKSENDIKAEVTAEKPDVVVFVYPVKATENCQISKGCGIVYKDGNAVTEPNIRQHLHNTAMKNDIPTQAYFGAQSALTEAFGILGKGAKVIPICIPVAHMGTRCEIADINDINAAANLVTQIISSEIGE